MVPNDEIELASGARIVEAWPLSATRVAKQPRELRTRQMRSKWGSCSTEGRVTLNQELLTASADLRREVIVEELLHLREPNHGKLFRALKRAHLAQ
jgi:predicted metal-dependent hydrolase